MQIPSIPSAAGIAGSGLAAAKGGESDKQAAESVNQQSNSQRAGGKSTEASALESSAETDDRGGNGQEMYDVFDLSDESTQEKDQQESPEDQTPPSQTTSDHPPSNSSTSIDFEA